MASAPSRAPVGQKARPIVSALEQACHHCPLVLFAFLTDADAASLACACSALSAICQRSYDIKRELPIRRVLAGHYTFVVRKIRFNGVKDQLNLVPKLPSTVTSLSVEDFENRWRVTDLPRSLTHFSQYASLTASISAAEDWPAGLTSLQLDVGGQLPPLPSNLREFGSRHLKVDGGRLPDSLTSLRLDAVHDDLWFHLPAHLTTLEMRLSSDTTTEHLAHLPASLTHFVLLGDGVVPRCFRADATETVRLPSGLRYLHLVSVPYRAFRDLPSSLEHLVVTSSLGYSRPIDFWGFDGPICHASLQTLELPKNFDFPIVAKDLPSLRELSLAAGFNQSLDDLPASLRKLTLRSSELKHPLDHLPADLTELNLTGSHHNHPMDRLPRSLLSLVVSKSFDQPLDALPSGLTRLDLSDAAWFDQPLNVLSESLQVLILPRGFDHPLQQLPSSLRVLQFHFMSPFNHHLPPLPDSLSVLHLGALFNQPLRSLPGGLTDLKFGSAFNHPLPLVKPEFSQASSNAAQEHKSLSFPSAFSSAADLDSLEFTAVTYPVALRSLQLGRDFNQPLSLPPSLTSLSIDLLGYFKQPVPISSLPATLTNLCVPRIYPNEVNAAAVRKQCPFL